MVLFFIQAFCLPVIQIVYETIQEALSGKRPGKVLIQDEGELTCVFIVLSSPVSGEFAYEF